MRERTPGTLHRATAAAWAATLLTAVSALAEPPPPKQEERCLKGLLVRVKPQEQKKKFRKATTPAEAKALLEPLGLLTNWANDIATCPADTRTELALDVFKARIVSASTEDFVLQARGTVCDRRILVGTVLHPLAGTDTFCALPLPFLPGEPTEYDRGTTFGFEHLTDPVRQVFKVESQREDGRNSEHTLEYWEAQEGELRSLFSISSGESIGFIGGVSSAEVSVEGSYPRVLRIDESSESCGRFVDLPSGATSYTTGCTRAENSARWCYQPVKDKPGQFTYAPCPGQ
jgi:hypothetical protein